MRVVSTGLLLLIVSLPVAADEAAWNMDLRQRAIRRADPAQNAARRTASVARGRQAAPLHVNVVEGSYDSAILAPIELIDQVISVYSLDRSRQERFRRDWAERGAANLLGKDFWDQLRTVLAPAIFLENDSRRFGALPAAEADAIMAARAAAQPYNDGGECRARAEALAKARTIWGEAFDRFLYEAVAPGVFFTTSTSDPQLLTNPEFWLNEWQFMSEGCR